MAKQRNPVTVQIKPGTQFGRWTVIKEVEPRKRRNSNKLRRYFECVCECGAVKPVCIDGLVYHTSESCGCSKLSPTAKNIARRIARKNNGRAAADKKWQSENSQQINANARAWRLSRNPPLIFFGPPIPEGMRPCRGPCHDLRPITDFWQRATGQIESWCKECAAAEQKARWDNDPEMRRRSNERQQQWIANNPERYATARKAWDEANGDKIQESRRCSLEAQRLRDPGFEARRAQEWREQNPEKAKESTRKYAKANPHVGLASSHRYRVRRLHATPKWADDALMLEFYVEAQMRKQATGIEHAVDHIVPLQSPLVCGLHCQDNLQVITGVENSRKGNRFWEGMWGPFTRHSTLAAKVTTVEVWIDA